MNIKHILQIVQTVSHTPTRRSQLGMVNGLVVRTDVRAGAINSPGTLSGSAIQVPVGVPLNARGNTMDIIGLLNPAYNS